MDNILIGVFLVGAISLVTGHGMVSTIGAFAIFAIEFIGAAKLAMYLFDPSRRVKTVTSLSYAALMYTMLARWISQLELWVDEVAVINIARLPIADVAHEAMSTHVVVPPLDYMNMWIWDRYVRMMPFGIWEVAYRVPYMAIHSVTAVLFAFLIEGYVHARVRHWFVYVVSFMVYFFNPLLFYYSLEVRFYAVMMLGVVLGLLLMSHAGMTSRTAIGFWVFLLNSSFQFLFLPLLAIPGLLTKSTRKGALLVLCGWALLAVVVLPRLYYPAPDTSINAIARTKEALTMFYGTQVGYWWQSAAVVGMILLVLLHAIRDRKIASLLFFACVGFLGIYGGNLWMNYRYFSFKHFLVLSPLFLAASFASVARERMIMRVIGFTTLVCVLLVPWAIADISGLRSGYLPTKDPLGAKIIMETIGSGPATLYIAVTDEHREMVRYEQIALRWYAVLTPGVTLSPVELTSDICHRIRPGGKAFLYVPAGDPTCGDSYGFNFVDVRLGTLFYL
jgi:hypothetical protein